MIIEQSNYNPLKLTDVLKGSEIETISAESLNLILNVKDAAGSTVVLATDKSPIMSMDGAHVGSYWGHPENLVWSNASGVQGVPGGTSRLISVTETATAAVCILEDATYDLEKLFESATTCRYVIQISDTQGGSLYAWIAGIAVSGTQYTITVADNVTTATGAQSWWGTLGSFDNAKLGSFKIFRYASSIVWGSTDTFTEELPYDETKSDVDQLKDLTNGQYRIDYLRGRVLGRKANADNTESVTYFTKSAAAMGTVTVNTEFTDQVDDAAFSVATATVMPIGYLADETATDSVDEGDMGAARMTLNRRQITANQVLDDAAFGIGTEYVGAVGFLADETTPDSVDEGDIGAPRMTLNRRIVTAGNLLDDGAFGVGTDYVTPMGALVDDTAPDSADEGDIGVPRMSATRILYTQGALAHDAVDSGNPLKIGARAVDPTSLPAATAANDRSDVYSSLQGEILVYLSRLISGEDQTNTVMQVVEKPLAVSTYTPDLDTSTALEASSVTKASAGVLYGASFSNTNAATRYLQFFNSTTVPADTAVPVIEIAVDAESTVAVEWPKGRFFSTGIAWCNSSTNGAKTIGAADSLADVNYK